MASRIALVTGFEPFGAHRMNPSLEVAKRLDGIEVGAHRVAGRVLPVAIESLRPRLETLVAEIDPAVVVSLGLAAGEPVIRLERVGLNLADFEIADNEGAIARDHPVEPGGPAARGATLPLRAISEALLGAGIPVRLSTTARTYLGNAALYTLLGTSAAERGVPCGFVHLPYLPEQAAALLGTGAAGERGPWPSMSLATMVEAVRIVVAVSLGRL